MEFVISCCERQKWPCWRTAWPCQRNCLAKLLTSTNTPTALITIPRLCVHIPNWLCLHDLLHPEFVLSKHSVGQDFMFQMSKLLFPDVSPHAEFRFRFQQQSFPLSCLDTFTSRFCDSTFLVVTSTTTMKKTHTNKNIDTRVLSNNMLLHGFAFNRFAQCAMLTVSHFRNCVGCQCQMLWGMLPASTVNEQYNLFVVNSYSSTTTI